MRWLFLGASGAVQLPTYDNASLIVHHRQQSLLIDVGGSVIMKLTSIDYDPGAIVGVVLTHAHVDHIYGLPSLIHQLLLMGRKEPLRIYGLREVLEVAKALLHVFCLTRRLNAFHIVWHEIDTECFYREDGLTISHQSVQHGVPALALRFDVDEEPTLFYSGDTTFDETLIPFADGTGVVVHEASHLQDSAVLARQNGHATAWEAGRFASMCRASELFLSHFDAAYRGKLYQFVKEAALEFQGTITIPIPLVWYPQSDALPE
jgi:ribonuclease Z